MSRPPKPPLTDDELRLVLSVMAGKGPGTGLRAAARAVSQRRLAKAPMRAAVGPLPVSHTWLRWQLARNETRGGKKPSAPSQQPHVERNALMSDVRDTERQIDTKEAST